LPFKNFKFLKKEEEVSLSPLKPQIQFSFFAPTGKNCTAE